jgi:hypothetical protein
LFGLQFFPEQCGLWTTLKRLSGDVRSFPLLGQRQVLYGPVMKTHVWKPKKEYQKIDGWFCGEAVSEDSVMAC